MINIRLCMIILNLLMIQTISVALIIFQGHSSIKPFKLKVVFCSKFLSDQVSMISGGTMNMSVIHFLKTFACIMFNIKGDS